MRLRPLTTAALSTIVLLPAFGLAAEPTSSGVRAVQTVTGTVAVPNPTKAALVVSRHPRTAGLTGPETNGVVGWFFPVTPATWGGEFVLESPTEGADFDLHLYSDPGSMTGAPAATAEFLDAVGDGERGVIPAGTTHALVYPAGAPNATFTYTGFAVPEIEIGVDSLDVTVLVGGSVSWINKTADYAVVDGRPAFDSGTGAAQGIPVDGTYTARFNKAGTFPYTAGGGSGTVTVVRP